MKAYYEAPVIGDGLTPASAFRPDLLPGYGGFVLCSPLPGYPTVTVLVAGSPEYHQQLEADPNVLWLADVWGS